MRIRIPRRPRFAALVAMGAVISMGVGISATRAQSPVVTFSIKAVSGTTLTIGSVYVANIKNTNNSGSSLTVTDNFYLISPSGMRVHLVPTAKSANMSVGGSWSTMQQVTTTTEVTSSAFPNLVLWRNDGSDGAGGWTFTDVSSSSKANLSASVMGVGVGDYDRNGFFDFISSNIGRNFLLKNLGNGTFRETAQTAGTRRAAVLVDGEGEASVTWGLGFADLNNDGYEDIYIAAGNMMMQMDESTPGSHGGF